MALVALAYQLLQSINDFQREQGAPPTSLDGLIECYINRLRVIDEHHRALLQADEDLMEQSDEIADLMDSSTAKYEELVRGYVNAFTQLVAKEGWPAEKLPRNSDVFSAFCRAQV